MHMQPNPAVCPPSIHAESRNVRPDGRLDMSSIVGVGTQQTRPRWSKTEHFVPELGAGSNLD